MEGSNLTGDEFRQFAKTYQINPAVDVRDDLHLCCQKLIEQVEKIDPSVKFIPSTNKRILNERFTWIFHFETLEQAIVKIEAEYPVQFTLTDTPDDGVEIGLEYYERLLSFEEAVEYRRTHPE